MISRRNFVSAGAATMLGSTLGARMAFAAAPTDKRFVFIIQRGAADGLGTVAPVGDPAFVRQRGVLAEDFADAPRLDTLFALHPQLAAVGSLYEAGQALFVHAAASAYRDRSHFDGQNVLETGGSRAYALHDGWMNRMLSLLPANDARGIAVAASVPLAMRGPVSVASYAPSNLPDASEDLMTRVGMLYAGDVELDAAWRQATATRAVAGDAGARRNAQATGELAARLLADPGGSRVAMIETGGWDTHAQQRGRLGAQLGNLDRLIGALRDGLGPLWDDTLVVVATEFGRTVRVNGTGGTDHGTASCAMLLGGGVAGGRVLADWPGLSDGALHENRDLRPTTDLATILTGTVSAHYRVDPALAMRAMFPDARSGPAVEGLMRG
ncbi:DUF1501 domain-containing protein [Sphingosinithalassobacter portus]|uniref:DUF1501 domain-containing protein n=1 Tax=Stakelama portus TaxID=2676234 RepID=UPI000D6E1548|nr:DUF1501 domain-containing protein [Sphingosinithalassobacter portus]